MGETFQHYDRKEKGVNQEPSASQTVAGKDPIRKLSRLETIQSKKKRPCLTGSTRANVETMDQETTRRGKLKTRAAEGKHDFGKGRKKSQGEETKG